MRDSIVKKLPVLLSAILLALCLGGCHTTPRSERSFDEIRRMVQGKTTSEIEALIGPPNTRQTSELGTERLIWWNYTFLGGQDYSPEVRGKIVHLQIVFADPITESDRPLTLNRRVVDPMSVSYLLP